MQRRFNEGKYWERMQAGEFTEIIIDVHPDTKYPEVLERHPGAKSVTTHYRDKENRTVVEVHYFRMLDGSVAPGMRPDPKLLFEDGVMFHQEKRKKRLLRLEAEAAARIEVGEQSEKANEDENAE
jgi:hypothetical protein